MAIVKDAFRNANGWLQLFSLIAIAVIGMIIGSFITLPVMLIANGGNIAGGIASLSAGALQIVQIISVIFSFLLPSFAFAYIFSDNATVYLKIERPRSWQYLILTILLLVVLQPIISLIGYYNEQLTFPDSMAMLERMMKSLAEANAKTMAKMMSDNSALGILANLFVIAFSAALVEELFFRGCLQQIMIKIVKNVHIGIWITAVIFSAIHFDIYGFVPRILLGAMLGYIFVWTGNIWYAILAHFIYNATVVLALQLYYKSTDMQQGSFDMDTDIPLLIASIIATPIVIYLFNKYRVKQTENPIENITPN